MTTIFQMERLMKDSLHMANPKLQACYFPWNSLTDIKGASFSTYPGYIQSNFQQHVDAAKYMANPPKDYQGKDVLPLYADHITLKTVSQGAATELRAAFDPTIAAQSGSFLLDSRIANEAAREYALDKQQA
jgi:hypothetical protein